MNQIIQSPLDNDLYKFTMAQAVEINYPYATAEYEFFCRGDNKLGFLADKVMEQVLLISSEKWNKSDIEFLSRLPFMHKEFLQKLLLSAPDLGEVHVYSEDDGLRINVRGKWRSAIFWEVKLLAVVNELYFSSLLDKHQLNKIEELGMSRLNEKIVAIRQFKGIRIADFGTRRRFSADWHRKVCSRLKDELGDQFVGTSNCILAKDLDLKPIGTMAHEFVSAHLALVDDIRTAQPRAFYTWLQTYQDSLGIALTDTFTTRRFFHDFDPFIARLFSGVRQDSGDPFEFAENMIRHYRKCGIDPTTKTIVFSDSLNVHKVISLWKAFAGRIGISFGIGTNLTNDVGFTPLNIVMKMVRCNDQHVCKISDDFGKTVGNQGIASRVFEMITKSSEDQ